MVVALAVSLSLRPLSRITPAIVRHTSSASRVSSTQLFNNDNITKGHRVIKKDHEIMIESLQKPTGDVRLISMCFFPLVIT